MQIIYHFYAKVCICQKKAVPLRRKLSKYALVRTKACA